MMRITVERTFNIGNYENRKVTVEADVLDSADLGSEIRTIETALMVDNWRFTILRRRRDAEAKGLAEAQILEQIIVNNAGVREAIERQRKMLGLPELTEETYNEVCQVYGITPAPFPEPVDDADIPF